MRNFCNGLAMAALCLLALPAQALTYQPMLDEDLLGQSPVVVRGQILGRDTATPGTTSYQVSVEQVYKGEVPVNEITLAVPGNPLSGRRIPGMPSFSPGDSVVLFLAEGEQGQYRLMQATLGAFRAQLDALGRRVFVRQLGDALALPLEVPNRSAVNETVREATDFLRWLGDPVPEQEAATLNNGGNTYQDEFNYMEPSAPARWWVFDEGGSVTFRAHQSGQTGMSGGGFAEFQIGIDAWNNDPGSNVAYVNGPRTTANGGLRDTDGVNAILFNDPNNEAEGTFNCQNGGVLAIGGFTVRENCAIANCRLFNGREFAEIIEGDIVTNDNTGCFFSQNNNTNGEEVFAHELGHTLGLGHSCEMRDSLLGISLGADDCNVATPAENQALMRATPHADGRGARLGSDDRAGIASLYPDEGAEPEPEPEPEPVGNETGNNGAGGNGDDDDGGGGGGCTTGRSGFDPLLPLLLLFSAWQLGLWRRSRVPAYLRG